MIFDTDVLIWCFRGNGRAAKAIERADIRSLSAVSLMELHQGARNRDEQKAIGRFIKELGFSVLPIDENISHRACIYVEIYCLKDNLMLADALIAATAMEAAGTLCTARQKHYKIIPDLRLKIFKPH